LALLALLLLGFEISVRLIQPDRMTYDASYYTGDFSNPVRHDVHMRVTDPRAIAYWQSAVSANPLPLSRYDFASMIDVHCNEEHFINQSFTFTFSWHGLPLESVTSDDQGCVPTLSLTSGGLLDPRFYALPEPLPGVQP
jgi:hypothetical protein